MSVTERNLFMGGSMRQDDATGYMDKRTVPETVADDDDDVVVALETARVSEERNDLEAAQKWLHRAAAAARRQGRPDRAGALSRSAARIIGQSQKFERRQEEHHVLADIDDEEFADQTIVETVDEIARKTEPDEPSPATVREIRKTFPVTNLLTASTPIASAPSTSKRPDAGLRVAVKKTRSGRFEARPLAPGEKAESGEEEALLVPVQAGSTL